MVARADWAAIAIEEIPGTPVWQETTPEPCAIVIFGITGDLAKRKLLPALFHLSADGALPENFAIVGVGRSNLSNDELREQLRRTVMGLGGRRFPDAATWSKFSGGIEYARGAVEDRSSYVRLKEHLEMFDQTR